MQAPQYIRTVEENSNSILIVLLDSNFGGELQNDVFEYEDSLGLDMFYLVSLGRLNSVDWWGLTL